MLYLEFFFQFYNYLITDCGPSRKYRLNGNKMNETTDMLN